jgi:hypothetical protein
VAPKIRVRDREEAENRSGRDPDGEAAPTRLPGPASRDSSGGVGGVERSVIDFDSGWT